MYYDTFFFQNKTLACACVDCEKSCPKPPPAVPIPPPYTIWGQDGYAVIMVGVFIVGSLLFLAGVYLFPSKKTSGK